MVEGLAQQIIDNFQKQTPSFQELIRMRLLRLRMALCSIVPSGRQRAAECRALLTLFSISTVLRSIFRPKAVSVQEKVSVKLVHVFRDASPSESVQISQRSYEGAVHVSFLFLFALIFDLYQPYV